MNIINYFNIIKDRINALNSYIDNPFEYKKDNKPYYCSLVQTYVWFEKEDKKS